METPQENGTVSIKTINMIKYGAGVNESSEEDHQVYTADPNTIIASPITAPQPESPVAEIGFVVPTTPSHQVQDHPLASVAGGTGVQGVVNTGEYQQQQPLAIPSRPAGDVVSAPLTPSPRSRAPPPPTASTPMSKVKVMNSELLH